MKRKYFWILLLLLLPFTQVVTAAPINIFVSVLPLKYFVERVAGDKVDVSVMVGPGQSPETYAPTPRQMQQLTKAKIYYRVGVPFEKAWINKLAQINPKLQIIDLRTGISLRDLASAKDPHIWTSPILAIQMAKTIRDSLVKLDPANKNIYAQNYLILQHDLQQLDQDIKTKLKHLSSRTFLVFHPAWGYFADQYGLTQLAIAREGKQPGARDLDETISLAVQKQIKTVIVQPQFSQSQARLIARIIHAKVVVLDPLAEDYLDNMHKIATSLSLR